MDNNKSKNCYNCLHVMKLMIDGKVRESYCSNDDSPLFVVTDENSCSLWTKQENVVFPVKLGDSWKGKQK